MKNYRYHNECIRRIKAQGESKPDPLAFFPGVCSGGCLFSSGGPTPTTPPPIFTLVPIILSIGSGLLILWGAEIYLSP